MKLAAGCKVASKGYRTAENGQLPIYSEDIKVETTDSLSSNPAAIYSRADMGAWSPKSLS